MAESMAYIGRKKCGCVVAATVDDSAEPDRAKQVARDVSDFIKGGLSIERVTVAYVRENLNRCSHSAKPPKQLALGEP